MAGFEVRPLDGGVGKEIVGLEIAIGISPDTAKALRSAWLEHGVLVFRGIGTSPEVQLTLSRCFGELEPHPIESFRMPGYPELILLSNEQGPTSPVYEYNGVPTTQLLPWHTDLAFETTPNAGALLRMVRKTDIGGETGWLDMAAAYDAVDDDLKAELDGLEAVYLFRTCLQDMRFNRFDIKRLSERNDNYPKFPPVANPFVWSHPETGRKVLNLSTLNIDHVLGMPREEGDALIRRLIEHVNQPRFHYIHKWENNDMVLWDNRRTMHMALGHPADQIRIVHRTTIKGTVAMGRIYEEDSGAA